MVRKVDLTGKRFHNLIAIYPTENRNSSGNVIWLCKCDCGNEVFLSTARLVSDQIKSCGCQRLGLKGLAGLKRIYSHYQNSAKQRGLPFQISLDEFNDLSQQNCSYCGSKPSTIVKGTSENGKYIYNGLDRIDSAFGYIIDNLVPCCKICNYMKRIMSYNEFVNHIERIYNNIHQ